MKNIYIFIPIALACLIVSCAKFPEQIFQVDIPAFSVPGGIYGHALSVELSCETFGAEIFYTTDGSIPTRESTKYTAPIALDTAKMTYTIKSRSYKEKLQESNVAVVVYTIVLCGTEDFVYWDKLLNSTAATIVAVDSDNNVYCSGFAMNAINETSGRDWLIKKFSADGIEVKNGWDKRFDGRGGIDSVTAMIVDGTSVYVAGISANLVGEKTGMDWWIKKFDASGNEDTTYWNKKFDGNGGDDYINDIKVDSKGCVYVVGSGRNLVGEKSEFDMWIKKFSPDGKEDTDNWNKKLDGNQFEDYLNGAAIDMYDNLFVTGCGRSLVSGTSGYDWFIKKFTSGGVEYVIDWDKKIDGNGGNDYAEAVAVDSNGNVYVAGSGENVFNFKTTTQSDWWIKKFDSFGNEDTVNWDKKFDGGNRGNDYINGIAVDNDNNVYIAGAGFRLIADSSDFDWWLAKFTSDGIMDTVSSSQYDNNSSCDYANAVIVDAYKNIYVAGYCEYLEKEVVQTDWWVKKFYN